MSEDARLFRKLADWFNPPDHLANDRVDVRVRAPDDGDPKRPVVLIFGDDGIVRWEWHDTEAQR